MKNIKQRGAALIVSLVMLTAVTFLAVLSLQSSSTQVKMVSNTAIRESVFQAAISALESAQNEIKTSSTGTNMLAEAMSSVQLLNGEVVLSQDSLMPMYEKTTTDRNYVYSEKSLKPVTLDVQYLGHGTAMNYTISGDSSIGRFTRHPFEMTSDAQDRAELVRSNQSIGFTFMSTTGH